MRPIFVVNNFGQFNHLIIRSLRDLEIEAKLIPNTTPVKDVLQECRGIILGGGPDISRIGNCISYLDIGVPILGICLGLHIIAQGRGGRVHPGEKGGYGAVTVKVEKNDSILAGYPEEIQVWASHADEVQEIPKGFCRLARSDICLIEAVEDRNNRIFGLQWHPEVSHSYEGFRVFENFDQITQES
ncbi:MAG: GMP synthase subunit A [Methanospirillaceae archaeon]|nr:GMP synthase subunit A [Methanospirillaceae archaeon]